MTTHQWSWIGWPGWPPSGIRFFRKSFPLKIPGTLNSQFQELTLRCHGVPMWASGQSESARTAKRFQVSFSSDVASEVWTSAVSLSKRSEVLTTASSRPVLHVWVEMTSWGRSLKTSVQIWEPDGVRPQTCGFQSTGEMTAGFNICSSTANDHANDHVNDLMTFFFLNKKITKYSSSHFFHFLVLNEE